MAKGVKVIGLRKSFGTLVAVDNVSFDVKGGEFLTLLGPSGCGKSTTLRLIAGLERAEAGAVFVGERMLTSAEDGVFVPPERRDMGMVFQAYALWPHMTVYDNVAFPLREQRVPGREIRERVTSALAMVGLESFQGRPAPLLSGGQQQRVALARALVSNPDVLLLDEPLSNLDARLREQMRFELKEVQARIGVTTIFVTHDQVEAMSMSDQVIVMNAGHIEQKGTPRQVYERPATSFVMDFLGRVNHLPAQVERLEETQCFVRVSGCELVLEVPLDGPIEVVEGSNVLVAVRSDAVRVSSCGDHSRLSGVVLSAMYMGGHVEYMVDMDGLTVRAAGSGGELLPRGFRVGLQIAGAGVRVWPSKDVEPATEIDGRVITDLETPGDPLRAKSTYDRAPKSKEETL